MVFANYGDRLTAVKVQDVTNPSEWEAYDQRTGEYLPITRD